MDNKKLLNEVYQNVQMILETLPEITKITTDCDFKNTLKDQEKAFRPYLKECKEKLKVLDETPKEENELTKMYAEWMTKLKARSNRDSSHLAEMVYQGYQMGIISLIKASNQYEDASKENFVLISDLLKIYEKSVESLKKYL